MAAPSVPLVQYNVLCSSLCEPSWFRETSPADLDPATRLSRVLAKLQGHIDATHGRAIIALQEVSMSWAGALDAWFAARGYHFVATLYGNRRNDYMGVALAFPLAHYALLETDISCPATSQRWGREPRPAPPTWVQAKLDSVRATLALLFWALTLSALWLPLARWLGERLGWYKPPPSRPPQSAFKMAQGRWNRLVYFRLALRGGADRGSEFGVGTYHMPCMFRNPDVMVLHAALCAQRVLSLARGAPCVLIGDFNFKPGDAAYRLITQGRLSTDDPDYPVPPEWERFSPTLSQRFTSAYVAATGAEPEYTNHCVSGMNPEVFTGTLDYIFFSPGWVAKAVTPLPSLSEATLCPHADEPSDHLLIGAELLFDVDPRSRVGSGGSGGGVSNSPVAVRYNYPAVDPAAALPTPAAGKKPPPARRRRSAGGGGGGGGRGRSRGGGRSPSPSPPPPTSRRRRSKKQQSADESDDDPSDAAIAAILAARRQH